MHVILTPELERQVEDKVNTGHYADAGEVIREALRNSFKREQEAEWMGREVALGHAQLEAGETVVVDSKEEFDHLLRRSR